MSAPFGIGRDGHLTELAFDRLDGDARADDPTFFAHAEAHLATCAACRARREELRARDVAIDIRPAPRVMARASAVRRRRGGRRALVGAGLGALGFCAMAALALLMTRPASDGPGFRAKGSALLLRVYVNDGKATRVVGDGDTITAGERASFAVRTGADGWLALFGWDATGRVYPIWPSARGDAPALKAAALPRQGQVTALPGAVRFDATPGDEHVMAVWCPRAFTLGELVPTGLVVPPLEAPRGCASRSLVLHKRP